MLSILKKFPKLERYNQIVWAVIGSGVVIAVVFSVLAVLAAMLYSSLHTGRGGMPVEVIDEKASNGIEQKISHYDFCQPMDVFNSPYQLIQVVSDQLAIRKVAVTMKEKKMTFSSNYADESRPYGACRIHGNDNPTGTVNVIIRNADDNSMHLLLKENAVVRTIEFPQAPSKKEDGLENTPAFPPAGVLYWEIALEDGNHDNVIDESDDLGAYLSDLDGSHLERITPALSRVLEKNYDKKRNMLTIRILRDANNDRMLDDQDKPSLIEVNVATRKMVREVLNSKGLTELMHQSEPKRQIR